MTGQKILAAAGVLVLVALVLGGRLDAASPGGSLKPGFKFVAADYPALQDYVVVVDELYTEFIDPDNDFDGNPPILGRDIYLEKAPVSKIRLFIGVSIEGTGPIRFFFDRFSELSQIAVAERLVRGSVAGLAIGDESLVRTGSTSTSIVNEIAFRRANIFVSIQNFSDDEMDCYDLAAEIDAALALLPDVTQAELDGDLPRIVDFSADDTDLSPGETANLSLVAFAPNGSALTKTYLALDGDTVLGPPDQYQAGSLIGTQRLPLVISNDRLLFATGSIDFNVTP